MRPSVTLMNHHLVRAGLPYRREDIYLLYILRCISSPLIVPDSGDALRLSVAFPTAADLSMYTGSLVEAQQMLKVDVYDVPAIYIKGVCHDDDLVYEAAQLLTNRLLHAKRSTGRGRPWLYASKSISNLAALVDAGPLPRGFW